MERKPQINIQDEATAIVKQAFGNDYVHDAVVLNKELMHAQGCGCGQCMMAYEKQMEKTVFKYTKPAVEEYGPDL